MNSVQAEAIIFLVAVIGGLITLIPVAIGLIRVYLQVQENKLLLSNRPTKDEVTKAIDQKITELTSNGTNPPGTTS